MDPGAAEDSRTAMPSTPRAEMTPLSREAWLELLARCVCEAAFEPPVRRHHRRYVVDLGAWRILYQTGRKPVELRVKLLNAAVDGVMVLSRDEVPEEVPALLTFTADEEEGYLLAGHVVHCTGTVGGYKVGVWLSFKVGAGRTR